MQPEDIDKLFRDRLEGHAPTPPAYLWDQLEAEIQPKRKRPVMWLAAAAVALLTLLGGAWWLLVQQGPASGLEAGTIASVTKESPEKKSTIPQTTPTTPSPSTATEAPDNATPVEVATSAASPARSAGVQPDPAPEARPAALARTSAPRSATRSLKVQSDAAHSGQALAAIAPAPTTLEQHTVAAAQPETKVPTPTIALASTSAKSAPIGPIEVEVRPAPAVTAMAVSDASDSGHRPRLGALLQQARNAVRGDKVSLTEAGLPEMVTVQARVGNRTLTKVIQL